MEPVRSDDEAEGPDLLEKAEQGSVSTKAVMATC